MKCGRNKEVRNRNYEFVIRSVRKNICKFDKSAFIKIVEVDKKFSNDEEYFLYEEGSELKHELINGNLYEISVHQYTITNLKDVLRILSKV